MKYGQERVNILLLYMSRVCDASSALISMKYPDKLFLVEME